MKKFAVFLLICAFGLGACGAISAPTNPPAPTVNFLGTADANQQTAVAQTLVSQPSPTIVLPTETFTPVVEPQTPTLVSTETPSTDMTTTFSAPTASLTFTPPPALTTSITASPTLGIRTYGTLPPLNTPYTTITLINKSKAEAYISLQVGTDQGYTVIEYPVKNSIKVKIPTGSYTYVAWVGGRQFVGYFNVGKNSEPTITLFKDKVVVQ